MDKLPLLCLDLMGPPDLVGPVGLDEAVHEGDQVY